MTRDQILDQARKMWLGEQWTIDRKTMQAAFGRRSILGGVRSPEVDFLDQLPGAESGEWTCRQDVITGAYQIARHNANTRLDREDGDRR